MNTQKNLFTALTTYNNLFLAYEKARKRKTKNYELERIRKQIQQNEI